MFGELMMRDGYAWVGISAQPGGIDYLKKWDPQRYGSLIHPGSTTPPSPNETYSDAIFTQTATALRRSGASAPLGGLTAQSVRDALFCFAFGISSSPRNLVVSPAVTFRGCFPLGTGDRVLDRAER